jgi:hypothetical protein
LFLITALYYYYTLSHSPSSPSVRNNNVAETALPLSSPSDNDDDDVEMVVASLRSENITWLHDYLVDWRKNIYTVDDENAALPVPQNKGREAMVFLT